MLHYYDSSRYLQYMQIKERTSMLAFCRHQLVIAFTLHHMKGTDACQRSFLTNGPMSA